MGTLRWDGIKIGPIPNGRNITTQKRQSTREESDGECKRTRSEASAANTMSACHSDAAYNTPREQMGNCSYQPETGHIGDNRRNRRRRWGKEKGAEQANIAENEGMCVWGGEGNGKGRRKRITKSPDNDDPKVKLAMEVGKSRLETEKRVP